MELTLDEVLQKAVEAYKGGQIQEADRLYKAILQAKPKHPDANHNMGVLAVGVGKVQEALPFFKTALEANPSIGQFWLSYIDALIKLNQVADAVSVLNQAKGKGAKGEAFDQLEQRLNSSDEVSIDPPQDQFQSLVTLYQQGQLRQALDSAKQLLSQFPNSLTLYNIQGVVNAELGHFDGAIDSYKKALKIKPDYAEVYYNLGNSLNDKGDLDAAIDSFQQALKIKPDYAEAYSNMGNALQDKGDLHAAIDSYKRAIKIKPNYAEAYNNMGAALKDKGDLEAAINSYQRALKIKPDHAEVCANILSLLSFFEPLKGVSQNSIVKINQDIRNIDIPNDPSTIISDVQIVSLFSKFSNCISSYGSELRTELSQTYRRNSVDLNCKRHKSIFNQHDIIPEFCFGCYKVQVEPKSIIDLIKLYVVFDQLELDENNTRKCMVELRPEIPGFYKGLIYCSGLRQASQIAEYLNRVMQDHIGSELSAKVKRGCSEYSISFPDYKEINNSGPQLMNYTEDWKVIEEDHDRKKPMNTKENLKPSLSGLNLNDVLIIRKWVDYARGIGDSSAYLINDGEVQYSEVYSLAKARLVTYHFAN